MSRSFLPAGRTRRMLITAAVGLLGTVGLVTAAAPTATAATPDAMIYATYPVTGSTTIASNNSTITLGPGKLVAALDISTSQFTANLTLPPATASFTEFGIVPVQATTEFIQDGPITGKDVNGGITSTAQVTIKLTDLKVAGLDIPIGDNCQTQTPATLSLNSGTGFNVLLGGPVGGSYTIPQFGDCFLTTPVLNLLIPGPNNTIALTFGKPSVSVTPPPGS